MALDPDRVARFAALFRGRTDAYGALPGRAVHERVTLRLFFVHLEGRYSIGIYPLLDDETCCWACADIDFDDVEAARELVEGIHSLGLNRGVYLERSRSKGWHVWAFFDRPVVAAQIRRVFRAALAIAGLPASTEVFPKQDRLGNGTTLGNYVNLPYFGGDRTDGRRMIVDLVTLEPIGWERFVTDATTFPAEALSTVVEALPGSSVPTTVSAGWMPELLGSAVPVGARRPSLVRLAGGLRSHGIDEESAVALLLPWSATKFAEPLPAEEIEKHVRGVYGRYGTSSLSSLERRAHSLAASFGATR